MAAGKRTLRTPDPDICKNAGTLGWDFFHFTDNRDDCICDSYEVGGRVAIMKVVYIRVWDYPNKF